MRTFSKTLIEKIVNSPLTASAIDGFIISQFQSEKGEREKYRTTLISELHRLQVFDWGGLYGEKYASVSDALFVVKE